MGLYWTGTDGAGGSRRVALLAWQLGSSAGRSAARARLRRRVWRRVRLAGQVIALAGMGWAGFALCWLME